MSEWIEVSSKSKKSKTTVKQTILLFGDAYDWIESPLKFLRMVTSLELMEFEFKNETSRRWMCAYHIEEQSIYNKQQRKAINVTEECDDFASFLERLKQNPTIPKEYRQRM
jgi:hypothetical protein